jgi:hypothetical protein
MSPPEFQLLLYCARSRPDAKSIQELVRQGVDWRALVELAQQHYVRPLLIQSLKLACWDIVPPPIRLELEQFYRINQQKNLAFARELLRLLILFHQNQIPIATFKGPALATSIYGDLALREFSDLDLLMHEEDLCKAEQILASCGYEADFPDKNYRRAFVSYQGQYAFRHSKTGISIDLHWQLASRGTTFPIRPAEVWAKLDQITIAGRTVPTLARDDLALFLAAHGTKEGWRSLGWVCDFAEFLRKYYSIDWDAILKCAQRAHSSRALLLAVALASTLLDAPAPSGLLDEARNNTAVRSLANKARFKIRGAASGGKRSTTSAKELAEFLNGLSTHDRFRHRLLPIATLLTTRTVGDYEVMPLPRSLWYIYYLVRPVRLACKAAQIFCRTVLQIW